MKRHAVNGRKADRDLKLRSDRTNALHYLAQKSSAILETSAVAAGAGVGAEKFVAEIAVAMFYIDEVEAQLPRQERGL